MTAHRSRGSSSPLQPAAGPRRQSSMRRQVAESVVAGAVAGAVLLALTGCAGALVGADPSIREAAVAQARWDAQGVDDYVMDVDVGCFCAVGRYRVVVRDGAVASVVGSDGRPSRGTGRVTVDDMFALALDDPHELTATYDPVLGYPLTMSVDPDENVIDEEVGYVVRRLEPLPGTR